MASCETQLWGLIGEIEPTQSQKEGAAASHQRLQELLSQGPFGQRIRNSYLSGSYARDTAIRPIDDVDIVFVVDPSSWPSASTTLLGVPSPTKILDSFADAIRYRYPVSSVFGQRRSVRLELYHLDIDVVPAINVDQSGLTVLIPDTDSGNWIRSAPKRQMELATNTNQMRGGNFKPLVKILKYWNGNLPSTTKFKSFAIETIATWLFFYEPITTIQDGLYRAFDFIGYCAGEPAHFRWSSSRGINLRPFVALVPDAASTGTNVVAGVEEDRRAKFAKAALRSRDKMLEAQQTPFASTAISRVREALHA